jgi:DNA helicase-2/ATP-dependent DNA helicase PcrA
VEAERVLDGLNPEQREAARCVRGPVCILAGAGTGKTTTITRRIAFQVASGAFAPHELLAVTFTDKAAGEMRSRLARLGVEGVVARTFHSAALAQLRGLSAEPPGEVLPSKALLLRQIGNRLPGAYRYRPAGDLAAEIEWAKNRRLPPDRYAEVVAEREAPIPGDLMVRVYREYERRKAARGLVDFEDLLELAIRMFDGVPEARERFRARYRAFTVDEYQDVNLLQQELLERWLGDRDDVCVVGDDHQSIYSFTGASPSHLLAMPDRFPGARVVRLEENYRSTPQVLALANRLSPRLGGVEKRLRATRGDGPEPVLRPLPGPEEEAAHLVAEIRRLAAENVPYEEIAILYRVNSRSEDYEAPLRAAGIPYQVRDGAFLERQAARRVLRQLGTSDERGVAALVRRAVEAQGYVTPLPDGLGEQERVRQADLGRLLTLAEQLDATHTVREYVEELERRFGRAGEPGRGVHLLTYHRAKGLEFEAVFLPRLEEGELPVRQAKAADAVAEERRLLYVGITRAKRVLSLTWSRRPSRFLAELGAQPAPAARPPRAPLDDADPALRALREWRRERSRADGVPAYVVFHDATLAEIAQRRPQNLAALAGVSGVGPAKLERYGEEVLAALAAA